MMDNKKHLNKRIMANLRKLCAENGMRLEDTNTLKDMQSAFTLDFGTKYVNGERCLSFDKIIAICNEFEYKFDDLLAL